MYLPLVCFTLAVLTAAAPHAALNKRDGDCSPYPRGPGPVASPDTVDAFHSLPRLQSLSHNASTPHGYSKVFTDLEACVTTSNYLGYFKLHHYDTRGCASHCNQTSGCLAFNLYAERDPTLNANAANCSNPPSTTNYVCSLWGTSVSTSQATNTGQYRDSFQVAITASNAYNRLLPSSSSHTPVLINGNFETGVLSPWATVQDPAWGWTFGEIYGPGHASAYGFTASLSPNPNHASGYSGLILVQNMHTRVGRNYSLAFDVFFDHPTPSGCAVEVSTPGGGVVEGSGIGYQPPSGKWVTLRDTFVAVGPSDALQVAFSCVDGASNAMQVDNFVVLPYGGDA